MIEATASNSSPEPAATGRKVDRDEVFVEYTKSICPVCKVVVDGQVNIRAGKVYLRKRCREHGVFEALVYGDAQAYVDLARFNKPGTIPLTFQTEVRDGCPSDCGLCPEHKQHACLGIIEVNTGCNLDCPICFADSGHQPDGYSITLEQCERMLDVYVESEGEAEVVMFSGGEPTIHPRILEFIDAARARPIRSVVLNTNGIRLATDHRFVAALAARDVTVYLQFDGFSERTHREIRGRDLRERKQRALGACAEAGVTVMLAAAVERGLNDGELGDILRFGVAHPAVRGIVFQPVTHAGRHLEFDPLTRLTNSDVIAALAAQAPDWLRASDFFPVPCCFPTCRSITYLLTGGEEAAPTVVPIPRLVQLEDYLDYVTNRVLPDDGIRAALEKLWSASAFPGTVTTNEHLGQLGQMECATCGVDLPEALADVADRAFMLVVQDFQDPYTLNVKTLMKCCVEEITPDGRIIPFCAYNSVGYREQVREAMSGVPVADVVPNAAPLRPLLQPSRYGSKIAGNGHDPATDKPGGTRGAPRRVAPDATNVGRQLR
jgi:7,8-dihydro-6-hydroxymethylpterin dimethyltransferase